MMLFTLRGSSPISSGYSQLFVGYILLTNISFDILFSAFIMCTLHHRRDNGEQKG